MNESVDIPVAILAGGLATRLRPITEKIPKALVEVAGRPFVFWQLEQLRSHGIRRVVLCVGYLGELVEQVVGTGTAFGLSVSYSYDGPHLLGTGGALRRALPLLDSSFLVLYGDSYLPIDFSAVTQAFLESKKPALMTVLRNQNQWDTSNVLFENGLIREYNKRAPRAEMRHIDYGLGAVRSEVLRGPADEPLDLADVYGELSRTGELAGYEVHTRFYEIGSHQGLLEAEQYFRSLERQ